MNPFQQPRAATLRTAEKRLALRVAGSYGAAEKTFLGQIGASVTAGESGGTASVSLVLPHVFTFPLGLFAYLELLNISMHCSGSASEDVDGISGAGASGYGHVETYLATVLQENLGVNLGTWGIGVDHEAYAQCYPGVDLTMAFDTIVSVATLDAGATGVNLSQTFGWTAEAWYVLTGVW